LSWNSLIIPKLGFSTRLKQTSQFDFGANWKTFSDRALTSARVEQAKKDFADLFSGINLHNRSFLDIGFGQGLSLLAANSMGANVLGCDINPLCREVLEKNCARFFPEILAEAVPVITGSILDEQLLQQLHARSPDGTSRAYDIVHSWGVLHHTGNMPVAIRNAAGLVAPEGYLVVAIYARHWSSKPWSVIKRFYNASPAWIQRMLITIFCPIIYLAKWLAKGRNPLQQSRGMDFYYDVIDWVGGYPYEYATPEEIETVLNSLGFQLERFIPAAVPTGCNQFVFKRVQSGILPP
jgi:SAM-dependent methyltransferase